MYNYCILYQQAHIPSPSVRVMLVAIFPKLRLEPGVSRASETKNSSSHSTSWSANADRGVHASVPSAEPGKKVKGTVEFSE